MSDFFGNGALASLRDHLLPGLWPLLVAFAVCALVVPIAIVLSRRSGLIAQPGGRHAHPNPTPVLGGLAMYVGFAVAVLIFLPQYSYTPGLLIVSGLAAGLLIIDDRRSMSPWVKFGVQVLLSLLAVTVFGIEIKFVSLPGNHIVQLELLNTPVSMFWLLGMQNTVNFLDGVDGLAAGVILIVALILMLAAGELKDIEVVK